MDSHATTPVDPRVLDAMLPYFNVRYGNAASVHHAFGQDASDAVDRARQQIAEAIGGIPSEICFTSGATESNNLALKGVMAWYASKGTHLITTQIEHSSVLDSARQLEQQGYDVTRVPVGSVGIVDPDNIKRAITEQTVLISVMAANNEVGTIQPIRAIGQLARQHGILFHTDAVQAIGKIPINVEADCVDLLSISAHKLYGPKGVGALYIRRRKPRVRLEPLLHGGGHELGLRSGTLPVPLIVGFGCAVQIAVSEMEPESKRLSQLRDELKNLLMDKIDGVTLNGSDTHRLPHNLNLSFAGVDGEALLTELPDVALSTGSACSTAQPEASHVLKAMGLTDQQVRSSVRFGLSRFNTREEVAFVAKRIAEAVRKLRQLYAHQDVNPPAPRAETNTN
jgi:cysteine desulfurase